MTFIRTLAGLAGGVLGSILLVPVLVIGAPFLIVRSLFLLAIRALGIERTTGSWADLILFDENLGWRAAPGCDFLSDSVEPFHVVTDDQGRRGTAALDDSDVLVLGDSFAFGYAVDESDCYWHHLTNTSTTVIAAPGYDLAQEYLWLTQLSPSLAGKVVVWFVYHGNDLFDTLQPAYRHYRKPYFHRDGDGWEIRTDHISDSPWRITGDPDHYRRLAEICSSTALADRAFDAAETLIAAAGRLCDERGAKLVLVSVPDVVQMSTTRRPQLHGLVPDGTRVDPHLPDRILREICERHEISLIDLRDYLTPDHYLLRDVHWTPQGHRRVARAILDTLHGLASLEAATRSVVGPSVPKDSP